MTSISGISSTSAVYQTDTATKMAQRKQDFQSLADALQSGNLSDAQKAFAQLQNDGVKTGQTQSSNSQSNSQSSPLQALASALQNGDLSGAQQAFTQLQQGMKAHHHHHNKQGAGSAQANSTSQVASSAGSGDGTSSTGGQISITA
jgi:DNA-binding FadR family transcriptional regulator